MWNVLIVLAALLPAAAQDKLPLGPPPLPPPDPRLYQTFQVRVAGGGYPGKPAYVEIACLGRTIVSNYTDETGVLITRLNVETVRGAPGEEGRMTSLVGCRTEVVLPGFRSDPQDPFLLHPVGAGEGWTTSITSYQAPEKARRAYTAGTEAFYGKKWDRARKQFQAALAVYPQYATAWFQLGALEETQGRPEEARKALTQAVQLDPRFTLPYVHLVQLAAASGRWEEVERLTAVLLPLRPVDSPEAYYYDAAVKLKAGQAAAAEPSARQAVDLDTAGHHPEFRYLAGQVMVALGRKRQAADFFRAYLKLSPFASDADRVRAFIERLE